MLLKATIDALKQIGILLEVLGQQAKASQSNLFIDARIGAHVRHVHDHFKALLSGLETGCVDYNQRRRSSPAETDITLCEQEHRNILSALAASESVPTRLTIISEIDCFTIENTALPSTVERELLYLINHTIHHVAIIKLILSHHGIETPGYLGLAPSTASYMREMQALCAQ